MELKLTVSRHVGAPPSESISAIIGIRGGTIGRHAENDLVLTDTTLEISRKHAQIDYRDGEFQITDCSRNGLMVNGELLGSGNSRSLRSGDKLAAGDYEIDVAVESEEEAPSAELTPKSPFDRSPATPSPGSGSPREHAESVSPGRGLLGDVQPPDVLRVLGAVDEPVRKITDADEEAGRPEWLEPDRAPPQSEALPAMREPEGKKEPPPPKKPLTSPAKPASAAPAPSAPELPADWKHHAEEPGGGIEPAMPQDAPPGKPAGDETEWKVDEGLQEIPEEQSAVEASEGSPSRADSLLLKAFLDGLDLKELDIDDDEATALLELAGSILREAVHGVRRVLIARAKIKDTFRLPVTRLQQVENNPLKFSVGVEETLEKLLEPQPKGYMPPVESVREVFEDLAIHEVAVITGMRAALEHVLSRFEPSTLEERLKSDFLDSLVPMTRKAKLWELFTERYEEIHSEARDAFDQLYGREFAEAYEAEIRALKQQRLREKKQETRQG